MNQQTSAMSQVQKRPHADTRSHSPPQSRKARVDEDIDFSLFDEGHVSVMDPLLFDGQLSDCMELSDRAASRTIYGYSRTRYGMYTGVLRTVTRTVQLCC